jgi:4'-phosphopantetheinyl transferase
MNGINGPNDEKDEWLRPARMPALGNADLHVWRARLSQPTAQLTMMQQLLSPDELARANRFHFDRDRSHFIAARAILRVLLGGYLGTEPGQLRLRYNPHGKPALACASGPIALCFNLSHSHELAVFAFARSGPLGIDLEQIRQDVPCEQMARYVLSLRENAALHAMPAHLRHRAFTNMWTCKEAYVKAMGKGLAISLDQLEVTLESGEPAQFLDVRRRPHEAMRWSFVALAPGAGYAGALVAPGRDWRIMYWQWPANCLVLE